MGYCKIPNLYRPEAANAVLSLDEVFVTEKIHGTSAHIKFTKRSANPVAKRPWEMKLFSGGVKHSDFEAMLDERFGLENIYQAFKKMASGFQQTVSEVIFYGEAYGGKCQRMEKVYGPLNFIVFEVRIDDGVKDWWLPVPKAEAWAIKLGLEYVWWAKGKPTVEWLNEMRDRPSEQARRNLGLTDAVGEGIVIRAINESVKNRWGDRILVKHKTDKFREVRTPRKIDPEKQKMLIEAREVAEEWVTPRRLEHVLDALSAANPDWIAQLQNMSQIIGAMTGDVRKESFADGPNPEIKWSREVQKAIGTQTAKIFKQWLSEQVKDST